MSKFITAYSHNYILKMRKSNWQVTQLTWSTSPVLFLYHTTSHFWNSILNNFIGMTCIALKNALISGKLCAKKEKQMNWMTFNRTRNFWKFQRWCYVESCATYRNQLPVNGLPRPRGKQEVTAEREEEPWSSAFTLEISHQRPGRNITLRLGVWWEFLVGPGLGFEKATKDDVAPQGILGIQSYYYPRPEGESRRSIYRNPQRGLCGKGPLMELWSWVESHSLATVTVILLPPAALCKVGEVGAAA